VHDARVAFNQLRAHGPQFVETYCDLVTVVMGPEAGYVLRVLFAQHGVR